MPSSTRSILLFCLLVSTTTAKPVFFPYIHDIIEIKDSTAAKYQRRALWKEKEWTLQPPRLLAQHRHPKTVVCTYPAVMAKKCTLAQFCATLAAASASTSDSTTRCLSGPTPLDWSIQSTTGELCLYQNGSTGSYNASQFQPLTDVCGHSVFTYTMNGPKPTELITRFVVTRPVQGDLQFVQHLAKGDKCQGKNSLLFDGYCVDQCARSTLNGKTCTSCTSCAGDAVAIDCSNQYTPFVTSCVGTDATSSALYKLLTQAVGAVCSWEALIYGRCTLDKYCAQLRGLNGSVQCTAGTSSGNWHMEFVQKEACEDGDTASSKATCYSTGLVISVQNYSLVREESFTELTSPHSARLETSTALVPCTSKQRSNGGFYDFGPGYCPSNPCPEQTTLDGVACQSTCHDCSTTSSMVDCSNIYPHWPTACTGHTMAYDLASVLRQAHELDVPTKKTPVAVATAPPMGVESVTSSSGLMARLWILVAAGTTGLVLVV